MSECVQSQPFLRRRNRWQDKRERQLAKLSIMRSAKARKRLENPPEPEPKLIPWHRFELGVRDKIKGPLSYGEAWIDLRSVRDAAKRLRLILKFCQ